LIIVILLLFRRSQRRINAEIDELQNSPSDYTIMVRGIPTNKDSDYNESLKNFFTNNIDPVKKYNVTKVNLLWEIDEIEEIETKIKENIKRKQNLLERGTGHEDREIKELDEENEKVEKELEEKLEKIERSPEYFAGMAFVSFRTEDGH
jgi:predicted RNase H-like nuclease (RuvC/YqgF family)